MLLALGAVSSALDALASLAPSRPSTSTGLVQMGDSPFGLPSSPARSASAAPASSPAASISPETMNALLALQGDASSASGMGRLNSLKQLFSQIDSDGDGQITRSEFENALGAGGTNLGQADDVFGKLDANGDGNVDVDEMAKALLGTSHRHRHRLAAPSDTAGANGAEQLPPDPLMQALESAATTTVSNSDGSIVTIHGDGSRTTSAPKADMMRYAASSYASFEQVARQQPGVPSTFDQATLSLRA